MKKMTKKNNNKGFSLVELIVVVLIMGIIAVALAPQVMKWVENSKINTDVNNCATLKSSVQTALANWQAKNNNIDGSADATYTINGVLTPGNDWGTTDTLSACITDVLGGDYPKTKYDGSGFSVTVEKGTGKVTVTCGASSATLK